MTQIEEVRAGERSAQGTQAAVRRPLARLSQIILPNLPQLQASRFWRAPDYHLHFDRPCPTLTKVTDFYFISKRLGAGIKLAGGPRIQSDFLE